MRTRLILAMMATPAEAFAPLCCVPPSRNLELRFSAVAAFEFIELTTESTISRDGYPVLRVHAGEDFADYLPGDLVAERAGRLVLARDIVIQWLAKPGRTKEEVELGRRFLE